MRSAAAPVARSSEVVVINDIKSKRHGLNNSATPVPLSSSSSATASSSSSTPLNSSSSSSTSSTQFPYSVVWTPLPGITCIVPSIGHVGVCSSKGVVHDFASSHTIGVGCLAFGEPHKVWRLDPREMDASKWDRAIAAADRKFARQRHNIFVNNCHHHVVTVLNACAYKGKTDWSQFSLWWHLMTEGQFINWRSYLAVYFFSIVIWICVFAVTQLVADLI